MKYAQKQQLSSRTQLYDATFKSSALPGSAPTNEISITLMGNPKAIEAAKALISDACAKENLSTKINQDTWDTHDSDGKLSYVTIHIPDLSVNISPERIIQIIHESTHCDIGAKIHAHTRNHDKKGITYYTPGIDIVVESESEICKSIVSNYIQRKINKWVEEHFISPNPGEIGLPDQLITLNITPHINHSDVIALYYKQHQITNPKTAKIISSGLAEHFSGLLGIPEHIEKSLSSRPSIAR